MSKKSETILIRLDSDIKESFRRLCESRNFTMTNVLVEQIKKLLIDFECASETTNIANLLNEKNFYKKEVELYKEVYSEITSQIQKLNRNNNTKQNSLYSELLVNNFNKIPQFYGYELIDNYCKKDSLNFIAFNEVSKNKLLIDFKIGSLNDILIGPIGKYYKQLCDKFKDENSVELVIITLNSLHDNFDQKIKKMSEKIGYKITIYSIDELFIFNKELTN